MSIIVEALKKAQGSLKTTLPSRRESTSPPPRSQVRKPKIKKHITAWVVASFLLLAVLSFYFLNRTAPTPTIADSAVLSTTPTLTPPSVPVPASPPVPAPVRVPTSVPATAPTPAPPPTATSSPPPLTLAMVNKAIDLDGIMYTPEKPLAVINGAMWGEGDDIGKFKISEIEKDFIKVTSAGQEFIIKLKR